MISSGDLQFCYRLIFMVVMLSTGKFTEENSKLVLKCIFVLFSVDFEDLYRWTEELFPQFLISIQ